MTHPRSGARGFEVGAEGGPGRGERLHLARRAEQLQGSAGKQARARIDRGGWRIGCTDIEVEVERVDDREEPAGADVLCAPPLEERDPLSSGADSLGEMGLRERELPLVVVGRVRRTR